LVGDELHGNSKELQNFCWVELLGNSHRWAACSKSFKKVLRYELLGNSTTFAAAHKQENEFGLSRMVIVTGGQQQKLRKNNVAVMSYVATVQNLQQYTSKKLSLG
jgi:hypothetical protein